MPLPNPPNLLNNLDYMEPVATGPDLSMEGSSAGEQANPAFLNSFDILQFSRSIDSVSGTSASAGPAASTSRSTVKGSRMRVGKSTTARYGLSQNLS